MEERRANRFMFDRLFGSRGNEWNVARVIVVAVV